MGLEFKAIRAETLYFTGKFTEALQLLEPLKDNTEMNFDYHLSYSWIMFEEAKSDPVWRVSMIKQAISHALLASSINESSYETFSLLGQMYAFIDGTES